MFQKEDEEFMLKQYRLLSPNMKSYSSEGQMIPVGMGEDANFTASMKVIANGDVFNGLDEESLKYTVTGYGISSEIA